VLLELDGVACGDDVLGKHFPLAVSDFLGQGAV
jgi:hypothetical protein